MQKQLGADDNGYFTLEQFENLEIFKPAAQQHTLEDVIQALAVFDHDDDGRLTIKELEKAMMNFGVIQDESEGGGKTNMTNDEFNLMHRTLKQEEMIVDNFIHIEELARLFMDQREDPDR